MERMAFLDDYGMDSGVFTVVNYETFVIMINGCSLPVEVVGYNHVGRHLTITIEPGERHNLYFPSFDVRMVRELRTPPVEETTEECELCLHPCISEGIHNHHGASMSKTHMIHIRMSDEQLEQVDALAAKEERGRSDMIRRLVEREYRKTIKRKSK